MSVFADFTPAVWVVVVEHGVSTETLHKVEVGARTDGDDLIAGSRRLLVERDSQFVSIQ